MTFYKTRCVLALILFSGSLWSAETGVAPKEEAAPETVSNAVPVEAGVSADPGFQPYKTILDRHPFGPEPVNFNPDAPGSSSGGGGAAAMDPATAEALQQQEEQKIIAAVRISALNVTPSGKIAVGFTDNSKQPAGTYYLKVGESRDGWTVKSADAREMTVTLEKDGVEATLALGEGSSGGKGGKPGSGKIGQIQSQLGRQSRAGLLRPTPPAVAPGAAQAGPSQPGGTSFIANLRARRRAQMEADRQAEAERKAAAQVKAEQERAAAEAAAERERQAAAEREQQREALLQIQEELRRQREAKEQQRKEEAAQAADVQPNAEQTE